MLAYNDAQAVYPVTIDPMILNEESRLNPNEAGGFDFFGYSVSISDDSLAVGAFEDDINDRNTGSTYIFNRTDDEWSQQSRLYLRDENLP